MLESEKGTVAILESQKIREGIDRQVEDATAVEMNRRLLIILEQLHAGDYIADHDMASNNRHDNLSGHWIQNRPEFKSWTDTDLKSSSVLYLHGIPGAGELVLNEC
jgi:hypothetical protein